MPIATSDIATKPAPNIVIYLPENSLPNIKPSPIPPIIPIDTPVLSIFFPPSKLTSVTTLHLS